MGELHIPTALRALSKQLPGNIAADVAPLGGQLKCESCDSVDFIDQAEVARYLAAGWPDCCGQTMTFEVAQGPQAGDPDQPAPPGREPSNDDPALRRYDAELAALEGCARALEPVQDDHRALARIYAYLAARFPHNKPDPGAL